MTFTRTPSGIANYPRFFSVDVAVYIEGRVDDGGIVTSDHYFYTQLFAAHLPKKRIKIKCVGNRQSVLKYVESFSVNGRSNSLAVIDRDFEGLRCTLLDHPSLIYTYGYSWENDFWTIDLAAALVDDLCLRDGQSNAAFRQRYRCAMKRISFLAKLDATLQLSGECLLPKNGNSCGIAINKSGSFPVRATEVRRLVGRFREKEHDGSAMAKEFLRSLSAVPAEAIIQGHLWASVVYRLVADICKAFTDGPAPTKVVLGNLALARFASSPAGFMRPDVFKYYATSIASRVK